MCLLYYRMAGVSKEECVTALATIVRSCDNKKAKGSRKRNFYDLLTVDHITKVYTQRELFHDASFYLQDGEKVGIIGINGTGKSTLLKIMAGLEEPDAGNVVRANHLVIRYLPQMPEFDPQKGALENVLSYAQIGSVHQQEDREEHEKWNLESNAKSMMTRLGIYNFDEPVGHLSGGQRKRLALVAVLLTPCDVLLLDEPTNHLDAEMAGVAGKLSEKLPGSNGYGDT